MGIRQELEAYRSVAKEQTVAFKNVRDHLAKGPLAIGYRIIPPRVLGELGAIMGYPGFRLVGGHSPERIIEESTRGIRITEELSKV
ncbi:MAG: hypothetical protein Q8Q15_02205 [bacterium]|nr:hypothetical protein [bacterium]